jgi:hypothetical protein
VNRFRSVAELALALQPYAPPDTRDLAMRIARIAGNSQVPLPMATPSDARIAVTGSTSVNWSGRTELVATRGKRIAVGLTIAGALAVGAAVAVAFVVAKRGAHHQSAVASAPLASASSSGALGTVAPVAPSTSSGIDPATPSASVVVLAPPSAPSATSTAPAGRPTGPGRPGVGPAGPSQGPAPTGSNMQGPSYRTSW